MHNVDFSFAQDPNTLSLAILYGMVPALIWVHFWLRENNERKRRIGLLTALFFGGAAMVVAALPVQQFIATLSSNIETLNILWAASEELLKFAIFALIVVRASSKHIEQPVDYAVYIMIAALGFAGFENALYFLGPLQGGDAAAIALSGSMRFLGTTLLHAACSSLVGIALGLAYFRSKATAAVYACIGLVAAVTLHSAFNHYIVQNSEQNFFQVFGFLWVATVVIMIFLEKLRRMGSAETRLKKELAFFAHIDELFRGVLAVGNTLIDDATPLVDILKAKGCAPDGPEYTKLKTLIGGLRALYAAYLESEGSTHVQALAAALAMVPDGVSAKSASGIIATLRGQISKSIEGKKDTDALGSAVSLPPSVNTAARG